MGLRICVFALLTCALMLAVACGSGSSPAPAPNPVFTSTPPTAATQDILYSYQVTATDPAGGTVSFAMSGGPSGANLSGSTLSWTPSASESRVSNAFVITATSSEGGHATQSWNITPAGTITGSWVDTWWTPTGKIDRAFDLSRAGFAPQAQVPQSNGAFLTILGVGNADGTFTIANVPGGYYWLQMGPAASFSYWTSSSTFDYGRDVSGSIVGTTPDFQTTTFAFNVDGLNPVQTGDQFALLTDLPDNFSVANVGFAIPSPVGATTMTTSYTTQNNNWDYSSASVGFLLQYEPVAAGSVTGVAVGAEETIPNLSLASGTTNNISGTLSDSPRQSFDLSVKGSQWQQLLQNAGPGLVTPFDAYISMAVLPFAPAGVFAPRSLNLPLFLPPLTGSGNGFTFGWPTAATCGAGFAVNPPGTLSSYAPIVTDQDFGSLNYGDPFDPSWLRVFSLCQTASVEVPVPGGGTPAIFYFDNGVNTAIPTSAVTPLAQPVVSPTINGSSLLVANNVSPNGVTLAWGKPAGTTPFAYEVVVLKWTTRPNGEQTYDFAGAFSTGKTTMALPPLEAGQTYVFVIATAVDARANVETSPKRSALPTAYAQIISAPITTTSGNSRVHLR